MTERLPREKYAEHIGEVFRIALDDDAVMDMTLIEANSVGPQTTKDALQAGLPAPFSVLFRGPAEPVLVQATYRLRHASLGELDLFLVPLGPRDDGIGYEAVFN